MGLIQLEGMEFFAHHGWYEEEKIVGNHFYVDLSFETDLSNAAQTDNIQDTVDYQNAFQIVKEQMSVRSNLIEHIARRILDALYQEMEGISNVTIKVSKKNPPVGVKIDKVSVTLKR
jgi:dihydroneopterin aldolase